MASIHASSPRFEHLDPSFWHESFDQSPKEQNNKEYPQTFPSDDPLQRIFTAVGLDPLTSRTCTTFYNVHKKMYGKILCGYAQDPNMAPFVDKLSIESIQEMSPSLQNAKIGEIYSNVVRSAKELSIPPFSGLSANPHLELSEIQRLAKDVQRVRDIDFLIFFTTAFKFNFLTKKIGHCPNASLTLRKDLENLPQSKLTKKTASSREWLRNHPSVLKGMTNLDFFGHGLTSIPPEIAHFSYLNSVNFSHNEIQYMPPEFNQLKRLYRADLSFNAITTLPIQLPHLHTLLASNNKIQTLGPEFVLSPQLRILSLANNRLIKIPRSFANSNLDHLSLSGNRLREIHVLYPRLNAMNSFNCEGNPLCFRSEFLVTLLDLLAIDDPDSKNRIYKSARLLLLKAAQKKSHHLRIQDQFKLFIRKLPESPLKKKLEEAQLLVNRKIINKMALSSNPQEIHFFMRELPYSMQKRFLS